MLIATSQSSKHKKHKLKAVLAFLESEAHTIDIGFVEVQGLSLPAADQHNQDEKLGQKSRKAKKKGTKLKALHHFLLMAGLGLDAAIMEHSSDALKHRFGPLAVGLSAVEELPALHPFPVEIRVGDSRQHGNLVWIGSFFFSLLELCFDVIYHLQPRPMLRRHSVAIGMLLLFIALTSILIVASVAPTIFLTLLFPVQVSPIHNRVFLDISSYIGSIFISLVLFQAIYVMVPHRHITFRRWVII